MKITEKQLLCLYEIAVGTLHIMGNLPFSAEDRRRLVNDIISQQSDGVIKIGDNLEELKTNDQSPK